VFSDLELLKMATCDAAAILGWAELLGSAILEAHHAAFGTPLDPGSFVFTTPEDGQIRPNNLRKRIFQPAAERAGIDPIPTVP